MNHSKIEATRKQDRFSLQYRVEVNINATVDKIWSYLVDVSKYPSWNSTIDRVEGTISHREKIKVFAKISPDRAFPVNVTILDAPKKMVWQGGMPLGLFKGIRTFTLTPQNDGSTQLSMIENFSGLMVPLMAGSMPDLRSAFEDFARDLKKVAEG